MIKKIYFAGGCFWGVQAYFSLLEGVITTTTGYANGNKENPTYEEVCTGETDFAETVMVEYDSNTIALDILLDHFFGIINPTSLNRQGNDIGTQYRTGIYYIDEADREQIIMKIDAEQRKYPNKIQTEVGKLKNFYEAEEYHQDYLDKNPLGYCHIDLSKAYRK